MPSTHSPSDRPRSAVLNRPATSNGFVSHVVCNWPRILIGGIEVQHPSVGDAWPTRVRARIDLGTLLPVDVRVELVPAKPSVADRADQKRMRSTESYQNGSYLFEASLPAGIAKGGPFTIRVTPAEDLPAWRYILRPIEALVPPDGRLPRLSSVPRTN
jgi:hypothetical protein